MNIKAVKEVVRLALRNGFKRSVFMQGPPGIGKSQCIQQVTREESTKEKPIGFVDFRLAQCDPTDIRGVMVYDPHSGKAKWVHASALPNGDAPERGVLFLDEINMAPPSVQASGFQLILDRRIGDYQLPENWLIIAAGNSAEDNSLVNEMAAPLMNRFVHIDVGFDFPIFKEHAVKSGFHPWVVGFLNYRNEYCFKPPEAGQRAFPTPRSWEAVSDVLKLTNSEMDAELVIGCVGKGVGTEFVAFGELATQLGPMVDDILDHGKYSMPKEKHHLFFILASIVSKIRDSERNIVRVFEYIQFLTEQKEKPIASVGYLDAAKGFPEVYRKFICPPGKPTDLAKKILTTLGKTVKSAEEEMI